MNTILANNAFTHIKMVAMTLAVCGKLHDSPEEIAILETATRKLGVTETLLESTPSPLAPIHNLSPKNACGKPAKQG